MKFKIKNILIDKPNINNRTYPRKLMQEFIDSKHIRELLENSCLFIEAVEDDSSLISTEIDISKVVGVVTNLMLDDNFIEVEASSFNGNKFDDIYMLGNGNIDADGIITEFNFIKFYTYLKGE